MHQKSFEVTEFLNTTSLAFAGFPCAGWTWWRDTIFSRSGWMLVRFSLKSPRLTISSLSLCFPRSWDTELKPFSTKYDVGNAIKRILTFFPQSRILNSNFFLQPKFLIWFSKLSVLQKWHKPDVSSFFYPELAWI